MEDESIVNIDRRHQRPETIRIVNVVYRPTADGENRLLQALVLLLRNRVDGHITSEANNQGIRTQTGRTEDNR